MPENTTTETTSAAGTPSTGQGDDAKATVDWQGKFEAQQKVNRDLESKFNGLRDQSRTTTEALAKAFGLKPEETSDVSTLTASVAALQDMFSTSQRENLVLSVANEYGITDKETIADLSAITDEKAMRNLANRLKPAENGTGRPRPDLTQGGATGGHVSQKPEDQFADFLKRQLGA